MLSFVKLLLIVLLMAVLLGVGLQNQGIVLLDLSPLATFRCSLWAGLFGAYALGLLTFALVHIFQDLKLRAQISRLKKEHRKVSDELQQLRNITLEDLPAEDGPESRVL